MSPNALQAVVFDLDGVITRTASLHAESWKRMFDGVLKQRAKEEGTPFRPFTIDEDYRSYVDGRPRIDGVSTFLRSRGIELPLGEETDPPGFETAWALGNLKNEDFTKLLHERGADVMEGTVQFIHQLIDAGVRIGVASSSKNCELILKSAGLDSLFEARVDGVVSSELGLQGKPHPDIFLEAARRMNVDPTQTVVVEDATSGVQAGRAGGFGLVIGIGPSDTRLALREHGADWIVESFDAASLEQIVAWFEQRDQRRPSALGAWGAFVEALNGRRPALFLDYDGTLTPIVSKPELAVLDASSREALRVIAQRIPTAIISGRGRPDVEQRVGIPELAFAGSHGFDIVGPNAGSIDYEIADWIEPLMHRVSEELNERLGDIEGCILEPKGFSVAVHYRLVASDGVRAVEGVVDDVVASDDRLKRAEGKKVFEIRPALDWDKGKALRVLLDALGLKSHDVLPIYIGDDVTDEDAFWAIKDDGIGILVSQTPRDTHASFWLQDTWEVFAFLDTLRIWVEEAS